MFCPKCGNQIEEKERYCSKCGSPIGNQNETHNCSKCGAHIEGKEPFCSNCGESLKEAAPMKKQVSGNTFIDIINERKRCLPSFIIGLIGSIFGMFGGICTTMCSFYMSNSAFFMIFGGAVIAMIGACLCLNKAKIGGPIQLFGAIMIILRAYSGGAEIMTIFSFVLLLASGIIGTIYAYWTDISKLIKK